MEPWYEFKFDRHSCWYSNACNLFGGGSCNSTCPRYLEMHYLFNCCKIPKKSQYPIQLLPERKDVGAFQTLETIKNTIDEFVIDGENLYIYSSKCGNGKTSWAIKLMAKYFDEIWCGNGFRVRGLFIYVPHFLGMLKNFRSDSVIQEVNYLTEYLPKVDLVIWDDIASTKLTEFDHSNLLTYIDARYLAGKANIYTGNIGPSNIKDELGARLASRVFNESITIELHGSDRRGK